MKGIKARRKSGKNSIRTGQGEITGTSGHGEVLRLAEKHVKKIPGVVHILS